MPLDVDNAKGELVVDPYRFKERYRQWQTLDAYVRKGEKASTVVFYKQLETEAVDEATGETETFINSIDLSRRMNLLHPLRKSLFEAMKKIDKRIRMNEAVDIASMSIDEQRRRIDNQMALIGRLRNNMEAVDKAWDDLKATYRRFEERSEQCARQFYSTGTFDTRGWMKVGIVYTELDYAKKRFRRLL